MSTQCKPGCDHKYRNETCNMTQAEKNEFWNGELTVEAQLTAEAQKLGLYDEEKCKCGDYDDAPLCSLCNRLADEAADNRVIEQGY